MQNLTHVPSLGEIVLALAIALLGFIGALLIAYWGFSRENKKKELEKATAQGARDQAFVTLKDDFDKERGGNSGGFRQAIDTILKNQEAFEKTQMEMMTRQGEIHTKVEVAAALLKAHVEQHEMRTA